MRRALSVCVERVLEPYSKYKTEIMLHKIPVEGTDSAKSVEPVQHARIEGRVEYGGAMNNGQQGSSHADCQ